MHIKSFTKRACKLIEDKAKLNNITLDLDWQSWSGRIYINMPLENNTKRWIVNLNINSVNGSLTIDVFVYAGSINPVPDRFCLSQKNERHLGVGLVKPFVDMLYDRMFTCLI